MPKSKPNRKRPKPRRKTPKRQRPWPPVVPSEPVNGFGQRIETYTNCPDGMWIDHDTGLPSAIGNEDWGPDLLSQGTRLPSDNSVC
jgi:hypothetical protein